MEKQARTQLSVAIRKIIRFSIYSGLLLLALSSCAYQKSESAGRVNGVYIKTQDFMNSLRGHFTGFMLEKDRTPDENEKRELYKSTWRDITIHVILKNYFDKYQIQVTQKEVIDTLLNNVPESIKNSPMFQTKGNFDKDKYVQTLLYEKAGQLDWLKQHYFNYYVPLSKLKLALQDNEIISKKELNHLHKIINNSADIDWIVFDPKSAEVIVSQSDIESYYHSNLNDYQITPSADLGWVAVPVKLNQDDVDTARAKIDSIYFELTNGKPFSVMVERFSQSSTARSGGALGFLKLEELSTTVRSALEYLDRNGVTRPLKLDNYWAIYQLAERTTNLVKLNELVIEITPGPDNKNQTKETAIHLRDLALQLKLETAAREMNYKYKRSGIVTRDSLWLKDKNFSSSLIDRAFTQKPGAILEPVYSEVMHAWIVTEVIEVQPFNYKQLINVNDEIYDMLLWNKQKSRTLDDALAWAQTYKQKHLETAQKFSLPVISTPAMIITDSVLSLPISNIFVGIIEDFQQKKVQKPYMISDKILLPVVSEENTLNPEQFTSSDVRKYYFEHINPEWFDKWLDTQIQKADINIWFSYP